MRGFGVLSGWPSSCRLLVVLPAVLAMVSSLAVASPAQAAVASAAPAAAVLPGAEPAVGVSAAGGFTSLTPSRLLNTLTGVGAPKVAVGAGGTVHLQVTGQGGSRPPGSPRWC